jgi:hypothetical protein
MKEGESVGRSVVVSEPAKTDRPTDNSVNSVKTAIEQTGICAKLHDTPTRALLERITARLEGNPPECLKNRIHLRFDAITNLGMLEGLAADVAESAGAPGVPERSGPHFSNETDEVKALALRNLRKTGRLL